MIPPNSPTTTVEAPPIPTEEDNSDVEKIKESDDIEICHDELNDNDVFCGRGAAINHRSGNRRFRALIRHFQPAYMKSVRKENKTKISRAIVEAVRNAKPPGRFLKKHPTKEVWNEIGDRKAWEKTSQTLRDLRDNYDRRRKAEQKSQEQVCPQQPERQTQHWYQEKDRQFQLQRKHQQEQEQQQHSPLLNSNDNMAQLLAMQVPSLNGPLISSLHVPPHNMSSQHQGVHNMSGTGAIRPQNPSCFANTFPANQLSTFTPQAKTNDHSDSEMGIFVAEEVANEQKMTSALRGSMDQEVTLTSEPIHFSHTEEQGVGKDQEEMEYGNTTYPDVQEEYIRGGTSSRFTDVKAQKRNATEEITPANQNLAKRHKAVDSSDEQQSQNQVHTMATETLCSRTDLQERKNEIPEDNQPKVVTSSHETIKQRHYTRELTRTAGLPTLDCINNLVKGRYEQMSKFSSPATYVDNKMTFDLAPKRDEIINAPTMKLKSRGIQTNSCGLNTKTIGTQTNHQDDPTKPITTHTQHLTRSIGTQTVNKPMDSAKEPDYFSCFSAHRPIKDLVDQANFQEFQTTLTKIQQEREVYDGTFSSEHTSLMQELNKWTYRPKNVTVETLQAHLFGYLVYPCEQRSTRISDLLNRICEENKVSQLRVIHTAASEILSQSNLGCLNGSINCNNNHEI